MPQMSIISLHYLFSPPRNLLGRGRKIIIGVVCFFYKFCQISTFYYFSLLIFRFTKEEAEVRKQALPFVPARYIRTFEVIFEDNCFTTKEAEVRNNCAMSEF